MKCLTTKAGARGLPATGIDGVKPVTNPTTTVMEILELCTMTTGTAPDITWHFAFEDATLY